MLNKLLSFNRKNKLMQPGDRIICALSGGADSVALLFALYLLKEKLHIDLAAAHFNHGLRGAESDRDEAFVRDFCSRYDIPLFVGSAEVKVGKKGLEAAARDARYAFFKNLDGKIATAHTADDNAETVLLHLVRGTGLKGLGGIMPRNGNAIRPMLSITRADVEAFLAEWSLPHIEDSSNETDQFLRNRLRHHVMPLLKEENPQLAENLSQMALRLRQDEDCLAELAYQDVLSVAQLRKMHPSLRARALERFLKENGVHEPEAEHIALAEALVFSEKPSASGQFPGGVIVGRNYDTLVRLLEENEPDPVILPACGTVELPQWGLRITCTPAEDLICDDHTFTVKTDGVIQVRSRRTGDTMRLSGGTKSLKKLFADRKIPAAQRQNIPVIADRQGVLGVFGIGINLDRIASALPAVTVLMEKI